MKFIHLVFLFLSLCVVEWYTHGEGVTIARHK
jgi:hypothetical protein